MLHLYQNTWPSVLYLPTLKACVCVCVWVLHVCGGREEKADVTLVTDAYGECVWWICTAHTPRCLSTVSVCLAQMLNEEHTPSSPTAAYNAANTKVTGTVGQTCSMLRFVYGNKAGLLICYQDYIYRCVLIMSGFSWQKIRPRMFDFKMCL